MAYEFNLYNPIGVANQGNVSGVSPGSKLGSTQYTQLGSLTTTPAKTAQLTGEKSTPETTTITGVSQQKTLPGQFYPGTNILMVQPKQFTPDTITKVNESNGGTSPVVKANTSDITTNAASLQAKIAEIQKQIDSAQKAGYASNEEIQTDAKGNVIQKTQPVEEPQQVNIWEKLFGMQKDTQAQTQSLQQKLLEQQNAIYSQWGLTADNFNKIKDYAVKIGDINQQIANIDAKEAQALEAIETRPGIELEFMGAEQNRISRRYSIERAGLAGKASALSAEAEAMQGNWDNAMDMAKVFVDNATKVEQQTVSDLKWGFESFSGLLQNMNAEDQETYRAELEYAMDDLKTQQDEKWKQMNYDLDVYKAQQDAGSGVAGSYSKDQLSYINTVQDNARQDPDIKIFTDVRGSYEQAQSAVEQKNSLGDIVLMRTIAKITDPTSSVREEEFRTFEGAQGALPRYGVLLTKQMVGKGQLTQTGRDAIMEQVTKIYNQRKGAYDYKNKFYNDQLARQGISEPAVPSYSAGNTNGADNDPLGIR